KLKELNKNKRINKNMNWYRKKALCEKNIISTSFFLSKEKRGMVKLAYMSKGHNTDFNDVDESDAYRCKVALTESQKRAVLTVVFMNDVHSFPLISETWKYSKDELRRAVKTFNRLVNVVEDLKAEYEDEEMPGPTLQGMAREAMRYIDIDRKKTLPSRSLEAAKYLDGETDWRSSIYGNRLPSQYPHEGKPIINISNTGNGTVNFTN
ncbi:hypothetical protein LCGC14_2174620, partial [marine sediment metagenome]